MQQGAGDLGPACSGPWWAVEQGEGNLKECSLRFGGALGALNFRLPPPPTIPMRDSGHKHSIVSVQVMEPPSANPQTPLGNASGILRSLFPIATETGGPLVLSEILPDAVSQLRKGATNV